MQSQTDNILQIYNELKKKDTNKIEAFIEEFKAQNKSKKKLTHKTFFELKKVCNEDFDEFIAKVDLTKNEAIIIGRALMQTKLKNKQNIVDALCEYKHSNIIILTHFLTTNCKVDLTKVVEMLENNMNETVDCLKLVLIIFRNYRQYFSDKMQEFVSQSTHPICNEIKNNL